MPLGKLTDEQLLSAIENEERLCLDSLAGELQRERADALDRYRGLPLGNEQEGRSQVVDKSVLDTIEWIMPSLVRIYDGGEQIGAFEPRGPEDEDAAKAETEVCNWYLTAKNDFFSQINATLRDALLLKNGYMVAYWQQKYDTMVETYKGLSDDEVAMIQQDGEVKIVEHDEYMDPNWATPMVMPGQPAPQCPQLHDVRVERKTCEEYVAVESVPPDEILVSRKHRWTSLVDADFVQWRRRVTIGQLRAEGFQVSDEEPRNEDLSQEWVSRQRFNEDQFLSDDDSVDPARRLVTLRDTYIRIDLRGTGKVQLWRICSLLGSDKIILRDEVPIIPFAAFSPIIYPHSHIGSSVYDVIKDTSSIKTSLQRQFLDSVYQSVNGEKVVDINRVNLDDMLVKRPGNIIRSDGAPGDTVMPMPYTDATSTILQGLEYMDQVQEQRVGVSRNPAGLDPNVLRSTATGVAAASAGSEMRVELIARTLASGFKDLFLIVHALALTHSTKPLQIKLSNKWVPVNPREWSRRTDFKITVGLGAGTPQAQLQKLLTLNGVMQQAMTLQLAGPKEAYNYGAEIWKAAGFSIPDRFIHPPATDPQTGQPVQPPSQPAPEVQVAQIRAQADQQSTQAKMQADAQTMQHQMQASLQEAQMKAQLTAQAEQARTQADVAVQQHKINTDAALEQAKNEQAMKLELLRSQLSREQAETIAHINANAQIEIARIKQAIADGANAAAANARAAGMPEAVDPVKALEPHLSAMMQAITAPRVTKLVKNPDGSKHAISTHPMAQTKTVQ